MNELLPRYAEKHKATMVPGALVTNIDALGELSWAGVVLGADTWSKLGNKLGRLQVKKLGYPAPTHRGWLLYPHQLRLLTDNEILALAEMLTGARWDLQDGPQSPDRWILPREGGGFLFGYSPYGFVAHGYYECQHLYQWFVYPEKDVFKGTVTTGHCDTIEQAKVMASKIIILNTLKACP